MTIASISASPAAAPEPAAPPPSDETTPAASICGDPYAELAALLVESDLLRAELDRQNLAAARAAQREAMAREVEAMHDAVDAIFVQACVQGGLALAGGATQCAASLGKLGNPAPGTGASSTELQDYADRAVTLEALDKGGATLGAVAAPLGQLAGGTAKARADAEAAQARNDASLAGSEADESAQHLERVARRTEAVLGLVETVLETEQQGSFAILSRF